MARSSSIPSTAYSVRWAHFRSTSSQVPRPLESDGIDESPKITPAQRTTGAQSENRRCDVISEG